MTWVKDHWGLLFSWTVLLVLVFVSWNNFFFWDTVQLGSRQAQWIYEKGYSAILLPEELDSGHFPLFGIYLSSVWQVFGRNLMVSHLSTLPFLLASAWLAYALFENYDKHLANLSSIFLIALTPYLGQAALVSPDIVMICFFLWCIYALRGNDKWIGTVAILCLCLISMRGMILALALFLWLFRPRLITNVQDLLRRYWAFLPGFMAVGVFFAFHFFKKGWIGFHDDSPWAISFELGSINIILKNILIYIWRILDYGAFVLPIIWVILCFKKRRLLLNTWLRLGLIIAILFALILIPFNGLLNPRYLIPIQIMLTFGVLQIIWEEGFLRNGYVLVFAFLIMFSGHFWKYPNTISQGWDNTLGHLPFYGHYHDTVSYLETNEIAFIEVGTAFPILSSRDQLILNGKQNSFKRADFESDQYILWSNVLNDFKDNDIEELFSNWKKRLVLKTYPVQTILFERQ